MTTEKVHARPRRVSLRPLSRIANKLALHRPDGFSHGDRLIHSTPPQSHSDTLHKVPANDSVTSSSSSDDFQRVEQVAKTLVDRDGTQSAPHITALSPSSRNGSGLSTRSRGTQRDDEEPEPRESLDRYGSESDYETHVEELTTIAAATKEPLGANVTFRARIHTQRRMSRFLDFLLFRDQTDTIQGVLSRAHPNMVRWVQKLNPESIVQVTGTLQKPPEDVRSASHSEVEVNVDSIYLVSEAHDLPFSNYRPPDSLQRRMEQRVLDLRNPANQALFRVRAAITRTFRNVLEEQSFMEIQTPKLQPAATESGAAVFKLNYFGRRAFLAQSPQLAKQMAISADFGRVYEVRESRSSTFLRPPQSEAGAGGLAGTTSRLTLAVSSDVATDWTRVSGRKLEHASPSHRVHWARSRNDPRVELLRAYTRPRSRVEKHLPGRAGHA